jgi:hypothetical protein
LAHTSFWPRFSRPERLRANQLMGLLVNELCLVVEHGLIQAGLSQALDSDALSRYPILRKRLVAMLAEEDRHSAWFCEFNHAFDPILYGATGFRFVSPPAFLKRLARRLAAAPGAWRLSAWLVMATEEWSCGLADVLEQEPNGELGPRDVAFQQLHAAHRRDERRHVVLDQDILDLAGDGLSRQAKRFIVAAARYGLEQLMRPRRAAPAMLARFVEEFPRWRPEQPDLIRQVLAVGARADYWHARGVAGRLHATAACAKSWGSHFWNQDDV